MCCKTLPMSGKRKANPSSHLYSILPAICQFHLILGQVPGSLQDVDAVAWNPFLETETVSLNYMIPLHGQGAHACALTHALSSASVSLPHPPSTASRHAKADPSRQDLVTLTSPQNYMCNENPPQSLREFEGPSSPAAKQNRAQAPWSKALTEPPYSMALRVRVECLPLQPEHRRHLGNV